MTCKLKNLGSEAFRASYNSDENGPGPPPSKKKSFEEGHYAIPVDLGGEHEIMDSVEDLIDGPIRSRGGSNITNNGLVEDFHFIEGTPAQFLNQQLTEPINNSIFDVPPPGLVKPLIDLHILSSGTKIRRSLAQKLKRHLDGSYSKYDGDRSSNSYPKDLSDGSRKQRRVPSKKSITPTKELMTKLVNPITEEEPLSAAQSPLPYRPSRLVRDRSFDSSISSTARIDNAVLKGKERLKMSRRSSTSASNRNSTANESEKSSTDNSDAENCLDEVNLESLDPKGQEQNCVDDSTETRSISQSISTANTSETQHTVGVEQNTYGNLCNESTSFTEFNQQDSLAISLEDLRDPDFKIRGFSVTSLKENSISNGRSSNASQRSLSICSELNSRIMFQRGGRNRASGKSNKVVEVPVPPQHPPPLPPRDYADIDDLMIDQKDAHAHEALMHHSFNPIYSNATEGLDEIPVSSENIDYVQICPVATTALKELSTTRSNNFKRSNSLYDILSIHQPKDATKVQNNEADYYASFDWTNVCMGPRALTSSASYLTHMLNKGQNIQVKDSANSFGKMNRK
uniref:WH2 domain-containing protein n=1 Tax=Meloidogyne hapla TaxID=6305 RepID=A0A1I8AX96_MELHA